jgi:hypothetical protein
MRSILFLLISLIVVSCNNQEKVEEAPNAINLAEIKFASTKIALVGPAQSLAANWIEYTKFETALENYDHSANATDQLATLVVNMKGSIPQDFDNQPIRSRLLVLETRIRAYQSFLKHTSKTTAEYKNFYNAVTIALDNFRGQLNEILEVERQKKELIEELKGDLRDLNAVETDTIP